MSQFMTGIETIKTATSAFFNIPPSATCLPKPRSSPMPTYEYETIPQNESETTEVFEIWQSMAGEPLKVHPETGVPVQRIISGGIKIPMKKSGCCESQCDCG